MPALKRVKGESQRLSRGTVERVGRWWRNRYRARVVDPVTGEVRVRELNRGIATVTEVRSRQQAARLLDQQLAQDGFEATAPGERIRALAYSERFLQEIVAGFRPASVRLYRRAIRRDLQPTFEGAWLDELAAGWLRRLMAAKAQTHALATVALVRKVALQMLRQAARDGYRVRPIHPADVRLPKSQRVPAERPTVDDEQLCMLLAGTNHPLKAMIALGGYAGLRAAEITGLRRPDVDLAEELLTIRQQADERGVLRPTKTSTSSTALPMLSPLVEILQEYIEHHWTPSPSGLLFVTRAGRPMTAADVRRRLWRPALRRLGLPHAGLHALRHGLPRRLLAMGLSAQATMRLLRHADLRMTTKYHHYGAAELRRELDEASQRRSHAEQLP